MAHTIGSLPARSAALTANPITASITVLDGETVFVLMLKIDAATARTGGAPTWGGYTFQQANAVRGVTEALAECWYIVNPLPGTNTLTIPNTNTRTIYYQIAMGRAAAGGASAYDGANGASTTGTNPTPGAIVTSQDGDILFAILAGGHQDVTLGTPAFTQIAENDDGAHGSATQYQLQASKGSTTMSWTHGTSDDYGIIAVAFKEIAPPNMENYKHFQCASAGVISVGEKIR